MRSLTNPLLLMLLLGGVIGYVAACNNAKPTSDANARQTEESADVEPTKSPIESAEKAPGPELRVAQASDNGAAEQAAGQAATDTKPPWERQLYFGEQHLHTSASPDAFVIGVRGDWEDAYNWALGKEITLSTTGAKIKKSTPYDFVAITDHAEYFGVMPRLIEPSDELSKSEFAEKLQDPNADVSAPDSAINVILGSIITSTPMPEYVTPDLLASNWKRYVDTTNKFNQPGKFTTLIAWEWTSI